jgi:hypothetical protein
LLDWIYLTLQSELTRRLDEIELKPIDKRKRVKYAAKYPGTVRKALTVSLALEHFAARQSGPRNRFHQTNLRGRLQRRVFANSMGRELQYLRMASGLRRRI